MVANGFLPNSPSKIRIKVFPKCAPTTYARERRRAPRRRDERIVHLPAFGVNGEGIAFLPEWPHEIPAGKRVTVFVATPTDVRRTWLALRGDAPGRPNDWPSMDKKLACGGILGGRNAAGALICPAGPR